jgi:hypothetical protein
VIAQPIQRTGRPPSARLATVRSTTESPADGKDAAGDTDTVGALQDAFTQEHERDLQEQVFLLAQRSQFDFAIDERTELQREYDTTRSMILDQMKQDDEVVKKYIELI